MEQAHKKSHPEGSGWLVNIFVERSDPEVCESLVGFSHFMGIFFFLESTTFTPAGRYNLIGEFVCHAPSIPFS